MEKNKTLVIVSGYFNPLHSGHIEYLTKSKELGDFLFVIVNNDHQREMKGSKPFMLEDERKINESIKLIMNWRGDEFGRFIFANGGDQNRSTIGETKLCEELGIELADGLGDKIQSSSWLINGKK
jgi:cytidyltransferase-like protein